MISTRAVVASLFSVPAKRGEGAAGGVGGGMVSVGPWSFINLMPVQATHRVAI